MSREKGQKADSIAGLEAHDDIETNTTPRGDRVFLTFQGSYFMIPEGSQFPKNIGAKAPNPMQFNNYTYRTSSPAEIEYLVSRAGLKGDIVEIHADQQQEVIGMINTGELTPKLAMKTMRLR